MQMNQFSSLSVPADRAPPKVLFQRVSNPAQNSPP
jgi:hypothetical protein